jgi:hypothetical protein
MILALDPASRLGWCLLAPGGVPRAGSRRLGPVGCELGEALADLWHWLNLIIATEKPSLIVYEAPYVPVPRQPRLTKAGYGFAALAPAQAVSGPAPMNAKTIEKLCAITGVIQMVAFEQHIECRSCTTGQATAFFTGKARWKGGRVAKKAATIARCRQLGYAVTDDNAADAIAIALFAASFATHQARPAPALL